MPLTPAQLPSLKANILANANTIPAGETWTGSFAGMAVSAVPNNGDGNAAVAGWYNLASAPAWIVWRDLPMETVLDTIAFQNMTPADPVPAVDLTIQTWIARSLACQGKQFNLQNLTIGRSTAPMKRANYRIAMQDALTNLPAGVAGALIAANWAGVRDGAKFTATSAEKLFSTGTGTTANPADLSLEGAISAAEVRAALNLA